VDFNIFEGMQVTGVPRYTLSQGRVCWADGKLDVVSGTGRYVNRPTFSPVYDAVKKANTLREPHAVAR
jgi:dihydropyrimidinase